MFRPNAAYVSAAPAPTVTPSAAAAPRLAPPKPGLPISFARSALFGVSERDRNHVTVDLATDGDIRLRYHGLRLNQTHALLWQAVTTALLEQGADESEMVSITSADLLRKIGWKDASTHARRWLWDTLTELQTARLELRTRRHRYSGALLGDLFRDEETGALNITVNRRAMDLLTDEVVYVDFQRKLQLVPPQLELWLHDYLSSQSNTTSIPVSVAKLHELCGSTLKLPQFRPRLRKACEALKNATNPLLKSYHIDAQDRLVYTKTQTRVLLLPSGAAMVHKFQARRDTSLDRVRMQRANVAL